VTLSISLKDFTLQIFKMISLVKKIKATQNTEIIYSVDNRKFIEKAGEQIRKEWESFEKFGTQFGLSEEECCSDYIFDAISYSKERVAEYYTYMFSYETHSTPNGRAFIIRLVTYILCNLVKKITELYNLCR